MARQYRQITTKERKLIEELLRRSTSGEHFFQQIDSLVVISKCDCGCPTVNFAVENAAGNKQLEHILADYLATVDGEDVGVILFERDGCLSSLEVYSLAGTDKAFGLPEIESLYSYDELEERRRNESHKR